MRRSLPPAVVWLLLRGRPCPGLLQEMVKVCPTWALDEGVVGATERKRRDGRWCDAGQLVPWLSHTVVLEILARIQQYSVDADEQKRVNFANARTNEHDFRRVNLRLMLCPSETPRNIPECGRTSIAKLETFAGYRPWCTSTPPAQPGREGRL